MTNSTWGNMLNQKAVTAKPQSNFQMRHLEHAGSNPMYVEHVQHAFKVTPSKVSLTHPGQYGPGSPWQALLKGK